MFEKVNRILLASQSPRRKEILTHFGLAFRTISPKVQEASFEPACGRAPREHVLYNAQLKGNWAFEQEAKASEWVLSADTVVVLGDLVLEKPHDLAHAHSLLSMLSGKEHKVLTGIYLRQKGGSPTPLLHVESSKVFFKLLTSSMIEDYCQRVYVLDKAGAYAIQSCAENIVERYEGSLTNIMGLPIEYLRRHFSCA